MPSRKKISVVNAAKYSTLFKLANGLTYLRPQMSIVYTIDVCVKTLPLDVGAQVDC